MTLDTALGDGAEFDAIRALTERWGRNARGIGDDAAVIAPARGDAVVVSVDTAIEGRHFRTDWLTPREIGYRAVTAALSDLAAMAAHPTGVLVAIAVPHAWRGRLMEIADGIGEAVSSAGTAIVGGNLSGAGELSITTTVLGEAFSPLLRSGVRDGDAIYVTGALGGPALALESLRAGGDGGPHRQRFARPVARLGEAQWLANAGATAAIDISDGLLSDLNHFAHASGVSIDVDVARIPCVRGASVDVVLSSGEEYELIIGAPRALDSGAFANRFGISLSRVGVALASARPEVFVNGDAVAAPRGYDHFSER